MNKFLSTPSVGEVIVEEFMKPLNISAIMLADSLGLSATDTRALLNGDIQITPELSKRLADYFGMSELFFFRLQEDIDSRNARLNNMYIPSNNTIQELALA